MNFFNNCRCIEDVKKLYHSLSMKWHPDLCKEPNALEIMKQINCEYETAFNDFKNIHQNSKGETYTAETESTETPENFRDIIEEIIHFENCKIEIVGSWIWISGNTKVYKEILKELNFHWCGRKIAWSYHKEPFRKGTKKKFSLDDLRNMFGSTEVKTVRRTQLAS